jgi:hypothetical protein
MHAVTDKPDRNTCGSLPVPSSSALREGIIED